MILVDVRIFCWVGHDNLIRVLCIMEKNMHTLYIKGKHIILLAIKKEVVTKIGKGKNLLPLSWFMKEIKSERVVYVLMPVVVL